MYKSLGKNSLEPVWARAGILTHIHLFSIWKYNSLATLLRYIQTIVCNGVGSTKSRNSLSLLGKNGGVKPEYFMEKQTENLKLVLIIRVS